MKFLRASESKHAGTALNNSPQSGPGVALLAVRLASIKAVAECCAGRQGHAEQIAVGPLAPEHGSSRLN